MGEGLAWQSINHLAFVDFLTATGMGIAQQKSNKLVNDYYWTYFGRGFDSRHLHHFIKKEKMEYINKIKSFLGLTNKQETDFEQYKVNELKSLAKERGLKGYSSLKKAELIDLLNQ